MKRIFNLTAFLIILLSAVLALPAYADGGALPRFDAVYAACDSNGVYLLGRNQRELHTERIMPQGSAYEYSFDGNINAVCIYNGKIYVLYSSGNQSGLHYVDIFENGKCKCKIRIINLETAQHTQLAADKSGNIYIIDNKNKVEVFGSDGKLISTLSEKIYSVVCSDGSVIGRGSSFLYSLGKNSVTKLYAASGTSNLYRISRNYIGDSGGSIFDISKNCQNIFSGGQEGFCTAAETDKYLVISNGNTLEARSKKNLDVKASYELDFTPQWICSYNNKVAVCDQSGIIAEVTEKEFREQEAETKAAGKTDSSTVPASKDFEINGKYIYLKSRISKAEFKNQLPKFEVSFGKATQLGTGMKVILEKSGRKREYTIVLSGDFTGEGNVNSRDINSMFNHLLGTEKLGGAYKKASDLNSDGKISNADLVLLARKISG